jgi:hypothetical protein
MRRATLLLAFILLTLPLAILAAEPPSLVFVRADENGGRAFSAAGLHLVAEIPGGYLGLLTPEDLGNLTSWGVSHEVILTRDDPAFEYLVQYDVHPGDVHTTLPPAAEVVYRGDGLRVLRLPADDETALSCLPDVQRVFRRPLRFVTKPWVEPKRSQRDGPDPDIQAAVDAVSQTDLQALVQTLQDFGTRHSEYTGGELASYWIRDQFFSYGYIDVALHSFNSWNDNVVCVKPGAAQPERHVVIGAHYDSYNGSNQTDAPGADDNGTGTACVLAVAELLTDFEFEYTLVFITFSGEEQGLYGSEAWASDAADAGMDIVGMINMDMLGYLAFGDTPDADIVFNGASVDLRNLVDDCLLYVPGFSTVDGSLPFGASSDHASFWGNGFRAIMFFEDSGDYSPYIHTANDVIGPSANNFAFMRQNVQLVLATTATLARPFHVAIAHNPLVHQETTGPFPLTAEIVAAGILDAGSLALRYRIGSGSFQEIALEPTGQPDEYGATIPAQISGSPIEYYLTAGDADGFTATSPDGAPDAVHAFRAGINILLADDAESDQGWSFSAPGDDATTGLWTRADPVSTAYQPEDDHTADPGTMCFVTGNGAPGGGNGDQDVDGGRTTLTSPVFDLSAADWAEISYWRWYVDATSFDDDFFVDISDDGGTSWTSLEVVPETESPWVQARFQLPLAGVDMTDQMRLRFIAEDIGDGSLVEALIDDVLIVYTGGGLASAQEAPAAAPTLAAYPNPFNPRTEVHYTLPHHGQAVLRIFDARGREVARPLDAAGAAGGGRVAWDASGLASGIYFAELSLDGEVLTSRKLTLVR